jgi:transcriptional regulator with XRE-family HTH domain
MNDLQIKYFRERHGLTQEELSKIAGVRVGTVRSWEQKTRNISKSAIKLLEAYEIEQSFNKVNESTAAYGLDYKEMYFEAKYTIDVQKELINNLKQELSLMKELNNKSNAG